MTSERRKELHEFVYKLVVSSGDINQAVQEILNISVSKAEAGFCMGVCLMEERSNDLDKWLKAFEEAS